MDDRKSKNIRAATSVDRRIGYNLRNLRILSGATTEEIAGVLGVSYQQLLKYEHGTNRLSAPMLVKLRAFYDIPYEVFFDGTEAEGGPPATRRGKRFTNMMALDHVTASVCRHMGAVRDEKIKRKIGRVVEILAS